MEKGLLSIIMPVFNVAPYLKKSIESVLFQSYKNIEILLIDDGSTDDSSNICDEYAKKDTRIKVIHKSNGGLSDARNVGLDNATGEYIAFVDSDDWLDINMYDKLIRAIKETESDVAVNNFYYAEDGIYREGMESTSDFILLKEKSEIFLNLVGGQNCLAFMVWNKVFKKDVIGNTRFKKGQIYEDLYFDRLVFSNCHKVCRIKDALYYYRYKRPGNTVTMFRAQKLTKFAEINDYIDMFLQSNDTKLADAYSYYGLKTSIQFYFRATKYKVDKDIIREIKNYSSIYYRKIVKKSPFFNVKYGLFYYFPSLYKRQLNKNR